MDKEGKSANNSISCKACYCAVRLESVLVLSNQATEYAACFSSACYLLTSHSCIFYTSIQNPMFSEAYFAGLYRVHQIQVFQSSFQRFHRV